MYLVISSKRDETKRDPLVNPRDMIFFFVKDTLVCNNKTKVSLFTQGKKKKKMYDAFDFFDENYF